LGIKRSKKSEKAITCKQVTQLIIDYINNELDAKATKTFEVHLKDCNYCLSFLNTYKNTIGGVRSMKPEDVPQEKIEKVRYSIMKKLTIITFIAYLC